MKNTENSNISKALALLNKQFGDGAAMTFKCTDIKKVEAVSTGSLGLDLALGVGGLPLGRICEIFGPESSGKSTICMQVCAEAQKKGYNVAYLDLENAFDPIYAQNLGIDLEKMVFAQPNCGEEAFQMIETLLKEKLVNVIIFDSVAAARTRAELNGEVGDNFIGRQAKLMSDGLKKITPLANEANCLCLFTNQLRMKIGVMFGCFTYDTRIRLSDGTYEKIGKIVESDKKYFVQSYNFKTKQIENKEVIKKYNNGEFLKRFEVKVADIDSNIIHKITVADDHTFITPHGEKRLSELKAGDEVYIKNSENIVSSKILAIENLSTECSSPFKYDLQIEGNANYFADDILVHNSPETTPGGEAMKFYTSVRMRISRVTKPIEGSGEAIGNETKVKVIKNKVAPPFREAVFDIIYNKGVDVDKEILDMAITFNFIEKAGAWFKYKTEKFHGKDETVTWLNSHSDEKQALLNKIKEALLHPATVDESPEFKFDPVTGEILEEENENV